MNPEIERTPLRSAAHPLVGPSDQIGSSMRQKIRDLLKALRDAGFTEIPGAGKGSHRKLVHPEYPGAVTVSGNLGDDAKRYQEKQVAQAIDAVQK